MIYAALLLALPVLVAGKLNDCLRWEAGLFTGVDPADFTGTVLNSNFPIYLKYECDLMYKESDYSGSGIPCGSSTTPACMPGPNISFPNFFYPLSALDALATEVQDRLNRGADNTGAGSLLDTRELELVIEEPTKLNVTFLSEGACDRNSIGLTRFPQTAVTNGDPRDMLFTERKALIADVLTFDIFFPNVDFEFCVCDDPDTPDSYDSFCSESDPVLTRGTTMRLIEDFRSDANDIVFDPGFFVTFFLLDDGFDKGFRAGTDFNNVVENILFSTPELNDPDMVRKTPGTVDLRQHAFVFKGFPNVVDPTDSSVYDFSDEIFFCFEDRRRFTDGESSTTDNDFEDLCIFISSDPPLRGFEPSAAPTTPDSAMPSAEPSFSICDAGILSDCGNVCCADTCGSCGGCNCADLDGGAGLCCPSTILFTGMLCMSATEVGCVVDDSLVCPTVGVSCPDI